jgi:hypothetical protein
LRLSLPKDIEGRVLSMWGTRDQNLSHMYLLDIRLAKEKREGSSFQEDKFDKRYTRCCQKKDCKYHYHMHYRSSGQSQSSKSQQDKAGIEKG